MNLDDFEQIDFEKEIGHLELNTLNLPEGDRAVGAVLIVKVQPSDGGPPDWYFRYSPDLSSVELYGLFATGMELQRSEVANDYITQLLPGFGKDEP